MPIEVDEDRRLDEIADATIAIAQERGVSAVTVRAVAERLGGSTSVVTNYIPNRPALLINALRHVERDWETEASEVIAGLTGIERLRAYARWMCSTTAVDEVMRRLLMEFLSINPGTAPEVERLLPLDARDDRRELGEIVAEAGIQDPEVAADVLHLLFRGFWLSSLEDPESWPGDAGARAAVAVIDQFARTRPDVRAE
ncbi:TetR/AcrR family transcriptional regulator [Catenulispora rubra]|uniref:TetR/AcrR family transcriptional regulator n=1 Tax=Catenulispora rubra TaxID=280293 RepID=UPI0018920961|nr:TetR/AcrR family transcriptional regulator [Catenulispora rubra]